MQIHAFWRTKLTPAKVHNTRHSIPGCVMCAKHRVTLKHRKTGIPARITAGQRGQKMGRPSKKRTGGNPSASAVSGVVACDVVR